MNYVLWKSFVILLIKKKKSFEMEFLESKIISLNKIDLIRWEIYLFISSILFINLFHFIK